VVLEFHHRDEKNGNVADMVLDGASIGLLQGELEGCRVVCVNCHRVRTAASKESWRLDPAGLETFSHLAPGERRNLLYIRDLLRGSAAQIVATRGSSFSTLITSAKVFECD
jgi:hypothetical protein